MNNYRILKALTISLLIISNISFGQNQSNPKKERVKEKIESTKIAYLTQCLQLTPQEAQLFWPIYNEYIQKRNQIIKNNTTKPKDLNKPIEEMTDKEIDAMVDGELIQEQMLLDLKKEYIEKFKAILPIKKVAKLFSAEKDFKKILIKKANEKPKK